MSGITYLSNGDAQCDNCGNVWDGNAQCNCWQWMYSAFDEFEELDESSDGEDDSNDGGDDSDDVTDFGHTDNEDSDLDSVIDYDLDSDDEYDNFNDIAINLNTIFDNIEVE